MPEPLTDEKRVEAIRSFADLLHAHIREARKSGLSVTFDQPIHSDTWTLEDVKFSRTY